MPRGIYKRKRHPKPEEASDNGQAFHNGSLERKMSPEFKAFVKSILVVAEVLNITQARAMELVIENRRPVK